MDGGLPWVATAAVCFLIGGLSGMIWGAVVRTVFVWHATWCVNSVCHRWGSRPHQTREQSSNVWRVGLGRLAKAGTIITMHIRVLLYINTTGGRSIRQATSFNCSKSCAPSAR